MAAAGWSAITWGTKWIQTLSFIVISPLVGGLAGFILMVTVYWTFRRMAPARVDRFFRVAQLCSSALLSHAHGANDAQKTMGIIVGLLVSVKPLMANETGFFHHLYVPVRNPLWGKNGAYTASRRHLFGGWRIVYVDSHHAARPCAVRAEPRRDCPQSRRTRNSVSTTHKIAARACAGAPTFFRRTLGSPPNSVGLDLTIPGQTRRRARTFCSLFQPASSAASATRTSRYLAMVLICSLGEINASSLILVARSAIRSKCGREQ